MCLAQGRWAIHSSFAPQAPFMPCNIHLLSGSQLPLSRDGLLKSLENDSGKAGGERKSCSKGLEVLTDS